MLTGVAASARFFHRVNTTVDFKADFDANFPDLRKIGKGDDRVPGRPVAEMIQSGLRARGFVVSEIENNEPFFSVTCRSGDYIYQIDISLAGENRVWEVHCDRAVGFFESLRGRRDEKELGEVLDAIHDILKNDKRVHEIRWFDEPQVDAFAEKRYATSPRGDLVYRDGGRSFRPLILFLILAVLIFFGILMPTSVRRDGPGATKLRNEQRIKNTSAAIEQFHIACNRWPTNLSELLTNSTGVRFVSDAPQDKWRREIIYFPPNNGTNGRVGSFGRDGRYGGSGLDEDFFLEIPNSR